MSGVDTDGPEGSGRGRGPAAGQPEGGAGGEEHGAAGGQTEKLHTHRNNVSVVMPMKHILICYTDTQHRQRQTDHSSKWTVR